MSAFSVPEVRDLVRIARAFDAGQCDFLSLREAACKLQRSSLHFPAAPAIKQMAAEWIEATNHGWPGHLPRENQWTEAQFKSWVHEQLRVFEPEPVNDAHPNA